MEKSNQMYVADTLRYGHSLDDLVEHLNIQVTRLLSGWEVTSLSGAGTDFTATRVVT